MNPLAAAVLADNDWTRLRVGHGPAGDVPQALRGLATATSEADAERWYWQIDNHVIVQGTLYDSAPPTVRCLFALLAASLAPAVRFRVSEALVELTGGACADGVPDEDDAVAYAVLTELRAGRWVLYGLTLDEDPRVRLNAITALGWLEPGPVPIVSVLAALAADDPDEKIRAYATELRAEIAAESP